MLICGGYVSPGVISQSHMALAGWAPTSILRSKHVHINKLLTDPSKQLYIYRMAHSLACVSPYVSNKLMFTKNSPRLAFPRRLQNASELQNVGILPHTKTSCPSMSESQRRSTSRDILLISRDMFGHFYPSSSKTRKAMRLGEVLVNINLLETYGLTHANEWAHR